MCVECRLLPSVGALCAVTITLMDVWVFIKGLVEGIARVADDLFGLVFGRVDRV